MFDFNNSDDRNNFFEVVCDGDTWTFGGDGETHRLKDADVTLDTIYTPRTPTDPYPLDVLSVKIVRDDGSWCEAKFDSEFQYLGFDHKDFPLDEMAMWCFLSELGQEALSAIFQCNELAAWRQFCSLDESDPLRRNAAMYLKLATGEEF